jgi:methionyl aminopeptidase
MLLYFPKNNFSILSNLPKNILIPDKNKLVNFNEISIIKKENEIKNIKYASKILSETLNQISILVKNKKLKTGNEVNSFVNEYLIKNNCYPSSYNFQKFPKSICISPNEIVCHGIPNDIQFKEGDIINFDLTVFYNGMFSIMVSIGKISPLKKKLIEVTKKSLYLGISICKPNINF